MTGAPMGSRSRSGTRVAALSADDQTKVNEAMARLTRALGTPQTLKLPAAAAVRGLAQHVRLVVMVSHTPHSVVDPMISRGYAVRQRVPDRLVFPLNLETPESNVDLALRRIGVEWEREPEIPNNLWLTAATHVLGQIAAEHGVTLAVLEGLLWPADPPGRELKTALVPPTP